MKNMMARKHHEARRLAIGWGFACFIATVSASSAALIFGMALKLSWPGCLILTLTAAAFTVGVVFTVFEVRRLTAEKR